MPDLDQDLPTGNELSWKAMFASTETVRAMVYRLLDAGLCRDDDEHPLVTDHRLDSTGYGIDDSPSGRIIRDLVDSQPEEISLFEPQIESVLAINRMT
jgi:hypothetical protein